jgi:hypothetical protein
MAKLAKKHPEGPLTLCMPGRQQAVVLEPEHLHHLAPWAWHVRAATGKGVSSVLVVPLDLGGDAEAVLNLYSGRSNGFSPDDVSTAEAFAREAAGPLRVALHSGQPSEARSTLAT